MTILQRVQKGLRKIDRMSVRGLPRALILILIFLVLLLCCLYVAGWAYMWKVQGKVDLPALKELLVVITGAQFLLGFGFLIKCLFDKNGDQIPDPLEEEKNNVKGNSIPTPKANDLCNGRKL